MRHGTKIKATRVQFKEVIHYTGIFLAYSADKDAALVELDGFGRTWVAIERIEAV